MKKRKVSLLLAFCLLVSCLPLQAGAKEIAEDTLQNEVQQRIFSCSQELDSLQETSNAFRRSGDAASRLVSYIQRVGTLNSDGDKYVDIDLFLDSGRSKIRFTYDVLESEITFTAVHFLSSITVGAAFGYDLYTHNASANVLTTSVMSSSRNYAGTCTSFDICRYTRNTQLYFLPLGTANSTAFQELCNSISHLSAVSWELALLRMGTGVSMYDLGFVRYFDAPSTPTPDPSPDPEPEPDPDPSGFTDVKSGDFYYDAVQWAVENGITEGTEPGKFSPIASCNRAQAVTFLWRAAGSPTPESTENPFTDVKEGQYYYNAVLWAVENGITLGTSSTQFSPKKTCNRGQIVAFLYRSMGSPVVLGGSTFGDVNSEAFYYTPVQWAVENEITLGTGTNTFSPNKTCTRGQIVTFLYRSYGQIEE